MTESNNTFNENLDLAKSLTASVWERLENLGVAKGGPGSGPHAGGGAKEVKGKDVKAGDVVRSLGGLYHVRSIGDSLRTGAGGKLLGAQRIASSGKMSGKVKEIHIAADTPISVAGHVPPNPEGGFNRASIQDERAAVVSSYRNSGGQ